MDYSPQNYYFVVNLSPWSNESGTVQNIKCRVGSSYLGSISTDREGAQKADKAGIQWKTIGIF